MYKLTMEKFDDTLPMPPVFSDLPPMAACLTVKYYNFDTGENSNDLPNYTIATYTDYNSLSSLFVINGESFVVDDVLESVLVPLFHSKFKNILQHKEFISRLEHKIRLLEHKIRLLEHEKNKTINALKGIKNNF